MSQILILISISILEAQQEEKGTRKKGNPRRGEIKMLNFEFFFEVDLIYPIPRSKRTEVIE